MGFELELKNPTTGAYLINDTAPNYALLEKVPAALFATAGPYPPEAIVAWQPATYGGSLHPPSLINGYAYVFAPTHLITTPTSGPVVELFNASGHRMFSSGLKQLVIVDYIAHDPLLTPLVKTYTPGRQYAVIPLFQQAAFNSHREGDPSDFWYYDDDWNDWIYDAEGQYITSYAEANIPIYECDGHVVRFFCNTYETHRWDSYSQNGFDPNAFWVPTLGGWTDSTLVSITALVIDVTNF